MSAITPFTTGQVGLWHQGCSCERGTSFATLWRVSQCGTGTDVHASCKPEDAEMLRTMACLVVGGVLLIGGGLFAQERQEGGKAGEKGAAGEMRGKIVRVDQEKNIIVIQV